MDIPILTRAPASQRSQAGICHSALQHETTARPFVAIVGSPNVGQGVLFNTLTGA